MKKTIEELKERVERMHPQAREIFEKMVRGELDEEALEKIAAMVVEPPNMAEIWREFVLAQLDNSYSHAFTTSKHVARMCEIADQLVGEYERRYLQFVHGIQAGVAWGQAFGAAGASNVVPMKKDGAK